MPQWFIDRPETPEGTKWLFEAFWDLHSDKSPDGMIRWSIAKLRFSDTGMRKHLWRFFWHCMQEMQAGYNRDQKEAAFRSKTKSKNTK